MWQKIVMLLLLPLLGACASYDGRGLKPGEAGLDDVLATMGQPALRWRDPDGSQQLAYPRGPAGFHTFMVRLGPDGKLQAIENVLDERHLADVHAGISQEQVLRILGPSDARLTHYFKARDELAWDWRYIEPSGEPMRMMVLFDATSGKVRSAMKRPEHSVSVEAGGP
jgi:hypothetical protein